MNNRINMIHERVLRLVYTESHLTFEELLSKNNSFSIHHRNLQTLAIKMYKAKNNLAPTIMKNVFPDREVSYDLRNINPFQSRNVSTVYNGTEIISFRGPTTLALTDFTAAFDHMVRKWLFKSIYQRFPPGADRKLVELIEAL